jgi:hypothetical protein
MSEIEQLGELNVERSEKEKKEGEEDESELTKVLRMLREQEGGKEVLEGLEKYFEKKDSEEEQTAKREVERDGEEEKAGMKLTEIEVEIKMAANKVEKVKEAEEGEEEQKQRGGEKEQGKEEEEIEEEEEQRLKGTKSEEKRKGSENEGEKTQRKGRREKKNKKKKKQETTEDKELDWYEMSTDEEEQVFRERTKIRERVVEAKREEPGETENREVTEEGVQEGTNKEDRGNDEGILRNYPCKSEQKHGSGGEVEKAKEVQENQVRESVENTKPERVELKLREEQKAERSENGKARVLRGTVAKKATAAVVGSEKGCQRGMRPHEKEKDKDEVVYITPGGCCHHTFPDCRGMVKAKKEKRETCKFCTEG